MRPNIGANSGHPTEIGRRHTIRIQDGEGVSDLLGTLTSLTQITKKDGTVTTFEPSQIVAWRAIEELTAQAGRGAPLSLRIAALEELSSITWPGSESFARGGWLYRISGGGSYRSNSVLLHGLPDFADPLLPLDQELELLIETFTSQSVLPTIHLPLPRFEVMDAYLDKCGWKVALDGQVMVADKPTITIINNPTYSAQVFDHPSSDFQLIRESKNAVTTMSRYPAHYICLYDQEGRGFAAGRIATHGEWAMVTAFIVAPAFRGQGWSKVLMKELLKATPATKIALQVDQKNAVAISLYSSLGFRHHHDYRFRTWGEEKA